MNIAFHLLTSDPNREANARRTIRTAEMMASFGHNVFVISNFPDFIDGKKRKRWLFSFRKDFEKNGVKHIQLFCVPFCFGGSIKRILNYLSFSIASRFVKLPKNIKFDYVVATEPPLTSCKGAANIAKRAKAKLVFDIHDIWPEVGLEIGALKENDLITKNFRRTAKYMYKKSDLVITVSKRKVEHLNEIMSFCSKKANFIPNATDDSFINQEMDKDFLNKYEFDKYFSIVHVGKVGKAQDLDSFIDLAKRSINNEKIRFFLLGDGVSMPHILSRIKNENVNNVIFCGTCNIQQCFTALVNAKCAYVSLVNKNLKDSVPTKLFEALYCGCPILLSASGESVDVVKESKLGYCSEPGDFDSLLSNFKNLYSNYNELSKEKEYAINFIKNNYERRTVTKKLEKLLKENL